MSDTSDVVLPDSKADVSFEDVLSDDMDYEQTQVESFRSRDVTKDNFKGFEDEISGEIQSVLETISELQKNRGEEISQLEGRKDGIDRESIVDQGLDDLEVSELRKRWALNAERRVFKWTYAFFLQRVRADKFKGVLDSIDEKEVQSKFMDRHKEMLEKEREIMKEQLEAQQQHSQEMVNLFRKSLENNTKAVSQLADKLDLDLSDSEDSVESNFDTKKEHIMHLLEKKEKGKVDMTNQEIANEVGSTASNVSRIKNSEEFEEIVS